MSWVAVTKAFAALAGTGIPTAIGVAAGTAVLSKKLAPKAISAQTPPNSTSKPVENIKAAAPIAPAAVQQVKQDTFQQQAKRKGIKSTVLAGETGGYTGKTILQQLG